MKKKIFATVLASVMVMGLAAGCGSSSESETEAPASEAAGTEAALQCLQRTCRDGTRTAPI